MGFDTPALPELPIEMMDADLLISPVGRDRFEGKRVLITGGAGFIGSNLALRLIAENAVVTIVDALTPNHGGNLFNIHPMRDRVDFHLCDLRDRRVIEGLVASQDIVFNLAGQTSHLDSMRDPFTDLAINCEAQLSILEACRHLNPEIKIVFASTRQLYGAPQYLPVDERHAICPVDVNGINKRAGESYHALYHQIYGLRSCSLRLTNTIGPRMRVADSRQTFVGVWIRDLLEGRPFQVWGGRQMRDFNDVDDVIEALLLCALSEDAWGKIFNLGGLSPLTLLEFADLLIAVNQTGSYTVMEYPPERLKIDIGDYYGDFSHICATLGWRPSISLVVTLRRTLEYFRRNLSHYI